MRRDAQDWLRYRFDPAAIERWAAQVPHAGHAASYRGAGFDPEIAGQWFADDHAHNIVAQTAATLRTHGWNPRQAGQAYLAIVDADPDVSFMDPNRAALQPFRDGDVILTLMAAHGLSVADALACRHAGITPVEAADPALDLDAVRAMAALRPGQPERPRHGW